MNSSILLLFRWMGWTLIYALALGGHPWEFPSTATELLKKHAENRAKIADP